MSGGAETYKLDDQVGDLLRLASQRHAMIFQENVIENLTPMQVAALVRLHEQRECSQNKLGRLATMDVTTIKGVVDRLRQKAFITARTDPNDKRRTLLSLSPVGEKLIEKIHEVGTMISSETLKPLSSSEQIALLQILKKLS